MRILLSAYACEPNRGSEPGIGWNWAYHLSQLQNYDIHVITRSNNKKCIEQYWREISKPSNLHFYYYDLPSAFIWLKHHGMPVNIYYALWLYGSLALAKQLHLKYSFDIAHHITFGVFRDATFLYNLGIPVILGPLGGAEYTPPQFYKLFNWKEVITEKLRCALNVFSKINPFLYKSFDNAHLILCKTEDTKNFLWRNSWRNKAKVCLELGCLEVNKPSLGKNAFLFVGRFIYWKGIKLVLEAFKEFKNSSDNDAKIIFIGKGKMKQQILTFARNNNIEDYVIIVSWVAPKDLCYYYCNATALIFPSLHDSSGNVVLEALSNGLPVISLDCGGPAEVLGETLKEMIVSTTDKSIPNVISDISRLMQRLLNDIHFRTKIQKLSINRAKELIWDTHVSNVYKDIIQTIG